LTNTRHIPPSETAALGGDPSNRVPVVLFLCVHNAGRSQMAAGWMRHLAGGRIEVRSGGSAPGDAVNPAAVAVMAERGIDIRHAQPRPWSEADAREADVVVTMGCGDTCPVFPGKRYEDWTLADPAGKGIEDVRPVRDEIERRVRVLMGELGLPSEAMDDQGGVQQAEWTIPTT